MIKTEDLNVDITLYYLETFVNTYDSRELGEKKMLLESLIQRADKNQAKNVKLTLQMPLEKFWVFISDISATGLTSVKFFAQLISGKGRKTQNRFQDLYSILLG